jgi:mRNA interferase MazF
MKPGDIVLTIIPQDDQQKIRPVLILKILPKYNDFLVCAVSSQLHQHIHGFDLVLDAKDAAFKTSGLKTSSVFRLSNLAVLSKEEIIGTIGFLQKDLHLQLLKTLAGYLLDG